MTPPLRKESSGFVAHAGVLPVLWTDFNFVDRPITAERGDWVLPSGQRVILDDHGGTRCQGNAIGRPTWDKADKYVLVTVDNDTFTHYEPEATPDV